MEKQQKDFEERQKRLEEREEELRKEREAFDKDRLVVYNGTRPSDVLNINIGGTVTSVLRRTLTSIPGSMLASKFSGRWDDSIDRDEKGNFFINQDYNMFWYVIQHLRNLDNWGNTCLVNSPVIRKDEKFSTLDFYGMIQYYGLTDAFYPVWLKIHKNGSTRNRSSRSFNKKELTTLTLNPVGGHRRRIQTYEVTLGAVTHIQVGWIHVDEKKNLYQNTDYEKETGLCPLTKVVALDLMESSLCVDLTDFDKKNKRNSYSSSPRQEDPEYKFTSTDTLEYSKGTIVRCENFGRVWCVNGKQVVSLSEEQWKEFHGNNVRSLDDGYYNKHEGYYIPIISVNGAIEVTLIALTNAT